MPVEIPEGEPAGEAKRHYFRALWGDKQMQMQLNPKEFLNIPRFLLTESKNNTTVKFSCVIFRIGETSQSYVEGQNCDVFDHI